MRRLQIPALWEIKRSIKERFAEIYFKLRPDTAWCGLVMWYINDSPWEEVGDCTGCDYCGRASHGEIPLLTLRSLIPDPMNEGKNFNPAIFTSLSKET